MYIQGFRNLANPQSVALAGAWRNVTRYKFVTDDYISCSIRRGHLKETNLNVGESVYNLSEGWLEGNSIQKRLGAVCLACKRGVS
jgi:hypothetical protein